MTLSRWIFKSCTVLGLGWSGAMAHAEETIPVAPTPAVPAPAAPAAAPSVEALMRRLEEAEARLKQLEPAAANTASPQMEALLKRLAEAEAKLKKLDTTEEETPTDPDDPKSDTPKPAGAAVPGDLAKKPEVLSREETEVLFPGKVSKKHSHLFDSVHENDGHGYKSMFDSLNPAGAKGKKWYEKINFRGYTQFRFTRTGDTEPGSADPNILGDRSVNGNAENFSIRRLRFIFFGDISDHLSVYFQPDLASNVSGSTNGVTFFQQLRDAYADVNLDKEKIHRLRVGLSKVPYGFENLQSSQNRLALDRTDAINSAVSPNERDLGAFYYWTPKDKQELFRDLVAGGLKGSGNYGLFGIGVYDGQGGAQLEQNLNLHQVIRFTYPHMFKNGQVVEGSIQGYRGDYVVNGSAIRPLGRGNAGVTPTGTGGTTGIYEERVAASFIWYPQPFGFQAEWNVGSGPGLNDAQTRVIERDLEGGYVQAMYKYDSECKGIFIPFVRYVYYQGGYRSAANAPFGTTRYTNLGLEWQIRKEMELVTEYTMFDGVTLNALNANRAVSYRNFDGNFLRVQFQINY